MDEEVDHAIDGNTNADKEQHGEKRPKLPEPMAIHRTRYSGKVLLCLIEQSVLHIRQLLHSVFLSVDKFEHGHGLDT